jgi:hypothetical protein
MHQACRTRNYRDSNLLQSQLSAIYIVTESSMFPSSGNEHLKPEGLGF